jgi:hypothetical protein
MGEAYNVREKSDMLHGVSIGKPEERQHLEDLAVEKK